MRSCAFGLILIAALAATLASGSAADDKERVAFEEKFADKLDEGWSWVREDDKAWKLDSGSLVIRTSTGALWQQTNNNRNILLRKPPEVKAGGFAVET